MDYQHIFINGAWCEPRSDRRISVECPANREIIGSCPEAQPADVDAAVAAARAALRNPDWAGLAPEQRANLLDALGAAMTGCQVERVTFTPEDVGGPIGHFAYFHRRHQASLWPHATDWLTKALAPVPVG